ncbi:MAG: hypothetical protein KAU35_05905 [candidate division Zixibacteria bacterium]|nr:hypothetical protein [candidate division Zixibacteria bacterium]
MRKARTKLTAKKIVKRRGTSRAKAWTNTEVAQLRKSYRTTPTDKIAKKLKRTVASIQAKARSLGLKKVAKRTATRKKTVKRRADRPGGGGPGVKKKVKRNGNRPEGGGPGKKYSKKKVYRKK